MYCPNCGSMNEDGAKFCSNCGTPLNAASQFDPHPNLDPLSSGTGPYQPESRPAGNSIAKNIGIGCLVAVIVIFFIGLSCTRACFGLRHRGHVIQRY